MTRFIPYEKLSKKEKKKLDRAKRRDWGQMSPVTRVVKSKKVYSRKGRQAGKDVPDGGSVLLHGRAGYMSEDRCHKGWILSV